MRLDFFKTFIFSGFILSVVGCANKAQGPTGGPKDSIPPSVVRSVPSNGALNFKKKQILIDFDENVSIEKAAENVLISPPQVKPPEVTAIGKRVTVNLQDDLKDSTTYTINFGSAIVDLNEKNPLKNFSFSFSTGNQIDTLQVKGTVINAEDLNPVSGVTVGVYKDLSDTVFAKQPFLRIGKSDDAGKFSVENLKKDTFKIYALGDANRDYFYQPGEGLAFTDSLIVPGFFREEVMDTVWKDSVQIDTIRSIVRTHFIPDNVLLKYFKENKKRQYFIKAERTLPYAFSLFFNAPMTKLPTLKPIDFEWDGKYILQKNNTMDSLTYWMTDSLVWKKDTLQFEMSYQKTDSLFRLIPATDTLKIFMRTARSNARNSKDKKESALRVKMEQNYPFTTNIAGSFEIYQPVIFRFSTPLAQYDLSKISLAQRVDTLLKPLSVNWRQVDSTKMVYAIDYKWEPEKNYELTVDSAAFTSIYQQTSKKYSGIFKIRSLDEYSSVIMVLENFVPNAVIQILDAKDAVIASKQAQEKGTIFQYLKPGDYYARLFLDENGNGKWDTGDFSTHKQPEEVFYYPKKMTLMPNWEFEETWDYLKVPLLEQKPKEIRKDAGKKTSGN
ncbi:MAG TPA: Ig-like domain-containing protein [Paludibacteraceae bacterium]|jgi:hypothetical protein|nr:Ig-like domain-containing protein [Paludibacteraceae bacterium]